jgi:4-hydroxy-tetrahydrodipicolinate synthase
MGISWQGVVPAITTPFDRNLAIDHAAVSEHVQWLVASGCTGIVPHGSLGEGATLSSDEKGQLQRTCVAAAGRVPVIPGIAALNTRDAIAQARQAAENGCGGLMVLPAYAYSSDWRESKAHVSTVIEATPLPCLLYNNPVAYRTDFLPEQIAELAAEHKNLEAVKESSTDVRRVTAIRALCGDRLAIGVGVDDALVEGVAAGATFWIAGLANALPVESVSLFNDAAAGRWNEARQLYQWFLPLLRLDTKVKFVQYIKLVQAAVGKGNARVRPPRLEVVGDELAEVQSLIDKALASRPGLSLSK